jgi:hypothetical protein
LQSLLSGDELTPLAASPVMQQGGVLTRSLKPMGEHAAHRSGTKDMPVQRPGHAG